MEKGTSWPRKGERAKGVKSAARNWYEDQAVGAHCGEQRKRGGRRRGWTKRSGRVCTTFTALKCVQRGHLVRISIL